MLYIYAFRMERREKRPIKM